MPHDPDLTPADEQVRRLLADARHTEPMPDDVAARLDRVLTDLAGERRDADHADRSVAVATSLAAARRRRTARNLLVAAAAVVAIGFGLNSVDLTVSGGDEDSAASDAGADSAGVPNAAQAEGTGPARDELSAESPGAFEADKDGGVTGSLAYGPPVRLTSDRFGAQVRRLHTNTRTMALTDSSDAPTDGLFSLGRSLRPGCPTTGWGTGLLVPARYDGRLGAVIFRKATGETQVVDLFLCGNDEPTRSITLPVR